MRAPDFDRDGWCLDDGEEYHRNAPATFFIPELAERSNLQVGDYAKLIFKISVDNEDEPVSLERMWVIVRERVPGGYIGMLDNKPSTIGQNDSFWLGSELPFAPRHVISIGRGSEKSIALGKAPVPIPWDET